MKPYTFCLYIGSLFILNTWITDSRYLEIWCYEEFVTMYFLALVSNILLYGQLLLHTRNNDNYTGIAKIGILLFFLSPLVATMPLLYTQQYTLWIYNYVPHSLKAEMVVFIFQSTVVSYMLRFACYELFEAPRLKKHLA